MRSSLLRNLLLGSLTLIAFSAKPLQAQTTEVTRVVYTQAMESAPIPSPSNMFYFKPLSLLYGAQLGYLRNVREQVYVGSELALTAWNGAPKSIMAAPTLRYYFGQGPMAQTIAFFLSLKGQIGCYYDLPTKDSYTPEGNRSAALFVGAGAGVGLHVAIDKASRFHVFAEGALRFSHIQGQEEMPSLEGSENLSSTITYYAMMSPTSPTEFTIGISYLF